MSNRFYPGHICPDTGNEIPLLFRFRNPLLTIEYNEKDNYINLHTKDGAYIEKISYGGGKSIIIPDRSTILNWSDDYDFCKEINWSRVLYTWIGIEIDKSTRYVINYIDAIIGYYEDIDYCFRNNKPIKKNIKKSIQEYKHYIDKLLE